MINTNDPFLRYPLLLLAAAGLTLCLRVFHTVFMDRRALKAQGANGGRALVIETRWNQSAHLLAAFAVLLGMGVRVALSSRVELADPLVRTLICLMDVVTFVLLHKERIVLKGRARQDSYYDEKIDPIRPHTHQRHTDYVNGES